MKKDFMGYVAAMAAAAAYGTNPLFAMPLYASGLDFVSVICQRYAFAILLVALMMLAWNRSLRASWREVGACCLMGVCVCVSSLGLFASYTQMDVALASTLLFVYPLIVAVIQFFFFHEKISRTTLVCIGIVIVGIWLLNASGCSRPLSLRGCVYIGISALSYALYLVGMNRTCAARMPTLTSSFYIFVMGQLVFLFLHLCGVGITLASTARQWGLLFCLALLPTAFSFICTTFAVQRVGSTTTAILGSLEPTTSVLIGVFLFNEEVSGSRLVGIVAIILSVTVVVAGDSLSALVVRFRRLFPYGKKGDARRHNF